MESRVRMPALFVGHGSPMNAVEDNVWQKGFKRLAGLLEKPKAILAVSAHWYSGSTMLTGSTHPKTIHDFYGFPEELYRVRYPAPGEPGLAASAVELIGGQTAGVTGEWGLDHGTWTVLMHAYPEADIPVVQLSIDARLTPSAHIEIGRSLAPLRDEGVLILGSGNIVHNLPYVFSRYFEGDEATPGWASRFDAATAKALEGGDLTALAGFLGTKDGKDAHPTPDHYIPLLYVAGAALAGGKVEFPIEGFDMGSLSMRTVLVR